MTTDGKIFDRAVNFLGATLLMCVAGIVAITMFSDYGVPDILQNLASGALAGIIGLLVQKAPTGPVPVEVQGEPVETVDVSDETPVEKTRRKRALRAKTT